MAIPNRLVVHQARIPTGDSCDGCEYYRLEGVCFNLPVHGGRFEHVPKGSVRTDACKQWDAYQVITPDSPAARLLEGAAVFGWRSNRDRAMLAVLADGYAESVKG